MNPYTLMIPQLLAGAVIVIIALRAVRQSRREAKAHEQRLAKRQAEHDRYIAELKEAAANPGLPTRLFVTAWADPSALRLTLDLNDSDAVPDITQVTRDVGPLLAGVSEYEEAIGGRGFLLTEAKTEPGRVVLTLTPRDAAGSADRVKRIAEMINADEPTPALGQLPPGVVSAHAGILAA